MKNLRAYGAAPFEVVVVHGGPGAGGELAPVASELASKRGVLEPIQTEMSVEGQVSELAAAIRSHGDPPVALLGWSWGAWLSLILAAQSPELVRKLILVSSGPFEEQYVAGILQTRLSRLGEEERPRALALMRQLATADGEQSALAELGHILEAADSYEPIPGSAPAPSISQAIYQKVWPEAAQMRRAGRLVEMAQDVRCPVLAVHGDYDPHPAKGVRDPLFRVITDFQFVLLEECGHTPWLERNAKDEFYRVLEVALR